MVPYANKMRSAPVRLRQTTLGILVPVEAYHCRGLFTHSLWTRWLAQVFTIQCQLLEQLAVCKNSLAAFLVLNHRSISPALLVHEFPPSCITSLPSAIPLPCP